MRECLPKAEDMPSVYAFLKGQYLEKGEIEGNQGVYDRVQKMKQDLK